MEIRKVTIKRDNIILEYQFVNEYWETRYAWGHKTTLLRNGGEILQHKVRYYNRTWESYNYQTCMRGAVEEYKQQFIGDRLYFYKLENNIDRFKRGEKQKVIDKIKSENLYKDLEVLEKAIRDKEFD